MKKYIKFSFNYLLWFLYKIYFLFEHLFLFFFVIIVRILKPFVYIRFGQITSYIIGHYVFDTEYYLSEQNHKNNNSVDYFFYRYKYESHKSPPNEQWDLMVRRHFRIFPIISKLYKMNMLIPGGESHCVKMAVEKNNSRDIKGILSKTEQNIKFIDDENNRGRSFLKAIGLNNTDKFVCLCVRDSSYKIKYQNWGADWTKHNHRNSNIETYINASSKLAEMGYWVFRIGRIVEKPFKVNHPRVIDYANSKYRSDFLDIWLMANCFFCITTGTGIDEVSRIFRKPSVIVNYSPVKLVVSYDNCITVPKYNIWKKNNKRLTLRECIIHSPPFPWRSYVPSDNYENLNFIAKDLKSIEIVDAVLEMESRLKGEWVETKHDKYLQNRFWSIIKNSNEITDFHDVIHPQARIGASFLRLNHEWYLN